jgi:hypothetical protein
MPLRQFLDARQAARVSGPTSGDSVSTLLDGEE